MSVWRSNLAKLSSVILVLVAGIFLALAALDLSAATASLPNYFMRRWQTEDGLPHNSVTAICQTREGYLWFGTYDGLARFDGLSFTIFQNANTPAMRSSRVTSMFEDDAGNLWIGYETGELTRYREGEFHDVDINPGWENRRIVGIAADRAGDIWLLNEEGRLARVAGGSISAPNAGTSQHQALMARNRQGTLWIEYGGKLFSLEDRQLVPVTLNSAPGEFLESMCPGGSGGFWMVRDGRVRKWDGQNWSDDLGPAPWGQSAVSTALETRSGCLAVGTLEQGLYLILPNRGVLHFHRDNGLPHDWVRSLCEDREGNLWVGTGSGGLVALRAGNVATVDAPDHWQGMVVLSVTAAHDGALWAGTEGAGLYRLLQDRWTHFGEGNGLSNLYVWSVSEDARGRIWVGTWGGGIFLQHGDRFERPPGLEDMTVPATAVLHARNGVTWIGTRSGLLRYDSESGAAKWIGREQGLTLAEVRSVAEDRDGAVWFGMLGGGLGQWRDGAVRQFRKRDGLSSDYVQCLHLDADGALWIGTYGGGLNRLKNGAVSAITANEGLPNSFISHIEEDTQGNFWISSHGGIFRISRAELNACADGRAPSVSSLSYGKGEGMPSLECAGGLQPAGCRTSDGRFWFPTSKGLVVVDPAGAEANPLEPPVVIEKMLCNGQTIASGVTDGARSHFQIPPGPQGFEFRYTALSFISPEKIRFQYRLEGLPDSSWTDAGTKRAITYAYVPPGNYTFRVIACNSDGVWNHDGAAVAFTVEPYFWQRWWFRALAGLAAASLLAGTVLWDARRRMRRKLERLERQRAIERERARIAQDIHDNLGANLTRISLLSQAHGESDDPPHTAAQLDRIYQTARDMTRAMDEIVWAVNPHHDTLDSLASYLGKFALDFLEPLDIRCRLDVPAQLPAGPPLTAEVRHNLFLAFQEALTNVLKHAAASEVCITLALQPEAFQLSVRDNGKGFAADATEPVELASTAPVRRGQGLANMRERLAKIGGRCEIKSSPGEGTEVKFVLPIAVQAG